MEKYIYLIIIFSSNFQSGRGRQLLPRRPAAAGPLALVFPPNPPPRPVTAAAQPPAAQPPHLQPGAPDGHTGDAAAVGQRAEGAAQAVGGQVVPEAEGPSAQS